MKDFMIGLKERKLKRKFQRQINFLALKKDEKVSKIGITKLEEEVINALVLKSILISWI